MKIFALRPLDPADYRTWKHGMVIRIESVMNTKRSARSAYAAALLLASCAAPAPVATVNVVAPSRAASPAGAAGRACSFESPAAVILNITVSDTDKPFRVSTFGSRSRVRIGKSGEPIRVESSWPIAFHGTVERAPDLRTQRPLRLGNVLDLREGTRVLDPTLSDEGLRARFEFIANVETDALAVACEDIAPVTREQFRIESEGMLVADEVVDDAGDGNGPLPIEPNQKNAAMFQEGGVTLFQSVSSQRGVQFTETSHLLVHVLEDSPSRALVTASTRRGSRLRGWVEKSALRRSGVPMAMVGNGGGCGFDSMGPTVWVHVPAGASFLTAHGKTAWGVTQIAFDTEAVAKGDRLQLLRVPTLGPAECIDFVFTDAWVLASSVRRAEPTP